MSLVWHAEFSASPKMGSLALAHEFVCMMIRCVQHDAGGMWRGKRQSRVSAPTPPPTETTKVSGPLCSPLNASQYNPCLGPVSWWKGATQTSKALNFAHTYARIHAVFKCTLHIVRVHFRVYRGVVQRASAYGRM